MYERAIVMRPEEVAWVNANPTQLDALASALCQFPARFIDRKIALRP